jgi:hypothetical protein
VSVRLVRQDELGVTLSCVARTSATAVHPVHEIASTVPDREDEDHATLERLTHDGQTAKSLGRSRCGVAVILGFVSPNKSIAN